MLVVAGAKRLRLLEMLNRRFPGTFMAPVMTTTRPPRRGERPGLTMNFATRVPRRPNRRAPTAARAARATAPAADGRRPPRARTSPTTAARPAARPGADDRPPPRRDMITADAEAGKYLETGPEPEAEGELIGTTLEAITRIKAMGAVPLLHVSYERAVAARTCEKVNPPPCTVLVCEDAEPPAGANFNFNTIITNGNSDKVLDALVAAVEKYYPDRVPV